MEVVRAKRRARKKKQSEKAASSAAAAFAAQAGQSQGLSLENLVPVPAGPTRNCFQRVQGLQKFSLSLGRKTARKMFTW